MSLIPTGLYPEIPKEACVIMLDAPAVTPKEYARRTGLSESAVRSKIQNGTLPVIKHTTPGSEGKGCTVLINLMKLADEALNRE